MSDRSVNASMLNDTNVTLRLLTSSISLPHGEWVTYPPANLAPGDTARWQTDSDGFMTGTEGSFTYQFIYIGESEPSIETVKLYWDNPYVGGNGYSISCSVPAFKTGYSGGDGDNATVTYTFSGKRG